MKKRSLIGIVTCSILFSGCSFTMSESINKDIKQIYNSNSHVTKVGDVNIPNVDKHFKDKITKDTYISFTHGKSLKKVLEELENLDGKNYFLHRHSENIIFPTSNMKVKTFKQVAKYLADTTGKTIYVDAQNALFKNRLQVVRVKNAEAEKYNFAKVPFKINQDISVKDAIELLKDNNYFNFSIITDFEDFEIDRQNRLFNDVFISFKGTDVDAFFKYLETKLNVFVDIDYERKIVKIHRYSKKFFDLVVDNKVINGSMGGEDTSVTTDSELAEEKITQKIEIDIYKEFEDSVKSIMEEAKARNNKAAWYDLDNQTGTLEVYADRKTIKQVQEKVEKFNDNYKDMLEIEIVSLEILLNKSYLFKTGIDFNKTGTGKSVNGAVNTPALADELLKFAFQNPSKGLDVSMVINSAQNFGYVANKNIIKRKVRNHIPYTDTNLETERYLKNIAIIDPEVDGGEVKSDTESDVITQPSNYTLLAHYSNGWVTVSFTKADGKLLRMDRIDAGKTQLGNPITRSSKNSDNIYIKLNDTIVTDNSVTIESSKTYDGLVPTEWIALNAIGGGSDDSVVYSHKVRLIHVKKVNPNR